MIQIEILSDTAHVPVRGTPQSAGIDLYADEDMTIYADQRALVSTGIAVAIPENHVGLIKSRSSLALKCGLDVEAGVIDADYRGPIGVLLHNRGEQPRQIIAGDRIAQLIVLPCMISELMVVSHLPATSRAGGWGSTGR